MYLSKGGGLTFIKSILSNLPIYFLSLFPIPITVAKRLEMIQREFLWGGLREERKFHLVKWREVCSLKRSGGLKLRTWYYLIRPCWVNGCGDLEWRRIFLERNYRGEIWYYGGGWCLVEGRGSYEVSLWRFI